ncbi:MAG: SNF2-related protein, partial [Allorhizobium sp.]
MQRHQQLGVYRFHVLLTSYNILLADFDELARIRWRFVVVDEAHRLKNQHSKLMQALQALP